MSLLAPLYFIGALAVGLPILFHLIRRQPKGQVEFSSLMFLQPTPPRLTRRSRLDNWFLLLLRGLALTLLAAAFARPFLRSVATSEEELPGRRIVMLVDTSASMQRGNVWQQALDHAEEILDDLQPADSIALVTFDSSPTLAVSFDDSSRASAGQAKNAVRQALSEARPSWKHTDLGRAIGFAGDVAVNHQSPGPADGQQSDGDSEVVSAADAGESTNPGPAQLILITDMQSGSELESLQAYAWPKELRLDVRRVATDRKTNASSQILAASPTESDDVDRVRVRVANVEDSQSGNFTIAWTGEFSANENPQTRSTSTLELPVQVPPGETRVVRMPAPPPGTESLLLRGDDQSFDNSRFVVSPEPATLQVGFLGATKDDPRDSLVFYLQRVPLDNPARQVSVELMDDSSLDATPDPAKMPLIVMATDVAEPPAERMRSYVEAGGRLCVVLPEAETSSGILDGLNRISQSNLGASEADVDDYVMLTRINFRHPVFEPMSDPQFNDFSKIRFWEHRTLSGLDFDTAESADSQSSSPDELEEPDSDEAELDVSPWQALAYFDDGDPAVLEKRIGKGRIIVLTTGWQPRSGQLALSTKFIPLIYSLFDLGQRSQQTDQYTVGESLSFPASPTASIVGPSGIALEYRSSEDTEGIDQPGVYIFEDGDVRRRFAVNLMESESRTAPMGDDELERFGVALGKNITTQQARENQRQLRDRELESQQKLWQWLLVTALGILGLETLLGGLWSRREGVDSAAIGTST